MRKKSISEKIVYTIVFILFFLYALYIVLPLGYCLNSALKADGSVFNKYKFSLSIPPRFNNFAEAFKSLDISGVGFLEMLLNSVIYSFGTTFLSIMSSTFLAYAVSKYDFKLKKFLYSLAIFVMIIPIYGSLPATFKLFEDLHLNNSWAYLLSTASGFGFNFIVIHSFFEGISKDYSEAAFIDGSGHFNVFFRIMLPMAIPAITAVFITSFIGNWNDYLTPLLYLKKMPTLSSGLWAFYEKSKFFSCEPIYFAGVIISLIPIITLYLCFQNTVMQKVYAGGLKG